MIPCSRIQITKAALASSMSPNSLAASSNKPSPICSPMKTKTSLERLFTCLMRVFSLTSWPLTKYGIDSNTEKIKTHIVALIKPKTEPSRRLKKPMIGNLEIDLNIDNNRPIIILTIIKTIKNQMTVFKIGTNISAMSSSPIFCKDCTSKIGKCSARIGEINQEIKNDKTKPKKLSNSYKKPL